MTTSTVGRTDIPTNVLVVGVGGQGVVMVSKVLARLLQLEGLDVKQSEVHGMAKRGGTVFSHIRYGQTVWSPTIPEGQADVLVALEWAEGLRWLNHLRPGTGTFISDTRSIVPPFACRDRRPGASTAYDVTDVAKVIEMVPDALALDASGIARDLGNERAANTVLLGALSAVLDYPVETWEAVLDEFVPPGTLDVNLEAFRTGRNWDPAPPTPTDPPSEITEPNEPTENLTVEVEITREWCKSCDICVQFCPERCLTLDPTGIVVLDNADACTGCRICEWLCPDFAINIHMTGAVEAVA